MTMTIHNKVIDHLNHVPTISVGISGIDINNQEEDISDSINHSPTSLLITAMSGWGFELNHKLFSLVGNNFPKSQSSQCSHASSPKCPKSKRLCVLLTSRCQAAWCLRSIYPSQFVELGQPEKRRSCFKGLPNLFRWVKKTPTCPVLRER